jgi:hypothetical protein
MQSSARLFNCARCRCQVLICSLCDRGNLYCGARCSRAARRQSARAATARYQRSRRGRFAHAERQRRYRRRRKHNVTHQGSPPRLSDETLAAESRASVRRTALPATDRADRIRCHLCGRVCVSFVRHSFLGRCPAREPIDLPPPLWLPD